MRALCCAYSARVHALRKNRRSADRFAIDLPIEIRARDVSFTARTKDLNQQGIAVTAPGLVNGLALGDRVSFSLLLQHVAPEGPARLDGTAAIVRMEACGERVILALKAEWLMTTPLMTPDGIVGAVEREGM